jgi:hypothetical protein
VQFLAELLLLSVLGGAGGTFLGIAVTAGYAGTRNWPVVMPAWASAGAVLATLMIGAFAGMYPAWRAARLSPPKRSQRPDRRATRFPPALLPPGQRESGASLTGDGWQRFRTTAAK